MRKSLTVTASLKDDSEWEIEVEFLLTEAEPDVGIMSAGAEDIVIISAVNTMTEKEELDPNKWYENLSSTDTDIVNAAIQNAVANWEPDYDEAE